MWVAMRLQEEVDLSWSGRTSTGSEAGESCSAALRVGHHSTQTGEGELVGGSQSDDLPRTAQRNQKVHVEALLQ